MNPKISNEKVASCECCLLEAKFRNIGCIISTSDGILLDYRVGGRS